MKTIEQIIQTLRRNKLTALLIFIASITTGLAQFTDALNKIASFFNCNVKIWQHVGVCNTNPLDTLENKSGWILVAYLDEFKDTYISKPKYIIKESSYRTSSNIPRFEEKIELTEERNVIIANYKISGEKDLFTWPIYLNTLSKNDYTGLSLPKGSILDIRDVAIGNIPGHPRVVWLRVAPSSIE